MALIESVPHGYAAMMSQGWRIEFTGIITRSRAEFRSALTSYSDQYTSNWAREETYGRMDPIPVFQNTQRQISFGWQAVAASIEEAIDINIQISVLINLLYPSYDDFRQTAGATPVRLLTGAPIIKLKFANLIADAADGGALLGTVDGFTHTPNLAAGFFTDADSSGPGRTGTGNLYPKAIDLSCTFYPLHSHTLGVRGGPNVAAKQATKKSREQAKNNLEKSGLLGHAYNPKFPYLNPNVKNVVVAPKAKKPNPATAGVAQHKMTKGKD